LCNPFFLTRLTFFLWLIQAKLMITPPFYPTPLTTSIAIGLIYPINFVSLIGGATMADVSYSMVLNAVILAYCMLPGVRKSFGT